MMSTLLPNEEREVDPAAQAKVAAILHGDNKAVEPQPDRRLCGRCGANDENWKKEIHSGAAVDLVKLPNNVRVGYATGKDDHARYTHQCPKKRRSDAGVPRTQPSEQPSEQAQGVLTREQRRELDVRIGSMIRIREAMQTAIEESDKAQAYYESYLDSLTGGA